MEGVSLLTVNDARESRVRGSRALTLLTLCVCLFVTNANSVLLGLVVVYLTGLSYVQSNALLGSPLILTAVLSIPVSLFARKHGARWIVTALAGICALALFCLAATVHWWATPSYSVLFILGTLLGCGGAVLNGGSAAIMGWFPERRHGVALGLFFFSYGLGPPVLGAYAAALTLRVGLAPFFLLQGALCAVVGVACAALVRDSPFVQMMRARPLADVGATAAACQEHYGQDCFPAVESNLGAALRSSRSWLLTAASGLTLGVYVAATIFMPSFFGTLMFHAGPVEAGWVVFVSGVVSAAFCVVTGAVTDRGVSPWGLGVGACAVGAGCFAGVFFVGQRFWPSVSLMVCGAVSVGGVANVCFFKLVQRVAPEQVDATIGLMEACGNAFSFLLPLSFSAFAHVEWTAILLAGVSLAAGGLAVALFLVQR